MPRGASRYCPRWKERTPAREPPIEKRTSSPWPSPPQVCGGEGVTKAVSPIISKPASRGRINQLLWGWAFIADSRVYVMDLYLESVRSLSTGRQVGAHGAQNGDGHGQGNKNDADPRPDGTHDERWSQQKGDQKQHDRDRARARGVDCPPHPLLTLRHDHSGIGLAIINPPLPIARVFPAVLNFFACPISS